MVKLGEYSGCPQIFFTVINTIAKNIQNSFTSDFSSDNEWKKSVEESEIMARNVMDALLDVDWWEHASTARLARLAREATGFNQEEMHADATGSGMGSGQSETFISAEVWGWLTVRYQALEILFRYLQAQMSSHFQRHVTLDYTLGEPLVPVGGLIVILLMIYNKRKKDMAILGLISAFLLQVNPLYVIIAYSMYYLRLFIAKALSRLSTRKKRSGIKKKLIPGMNKKDIMSYKPESISAFMANNATSSSVLADVVLIGNDIGTLYTAALLSQAGKRCVVLEPWNCQPYKVSATSDPNLPDAYVENISIGNPERNQVIFEKVLRIDECDELQRLVLRPIGSSADEYTHSVIRLKNVTKKNRKDDVVVMRPGKQTLLEDIFDAAGAALPNNLSQRLQAEKGNKIVSPIVAICQFFNYIENFAYPSLSQYVTFKMPNTNSSGLAETEKENLLVAFIKSLLGMKIGSVKLSQAAAQDIRNLGTLTISGLLSQTLKSNEPSSKTSQKAFGFLAGVAATVASNEYLSPKLLASINIPYAIGQSKDGLFSPDGGCEALRNSMLSVIRSAGGSVVSNVDIDTLIFDSSIMTRVAGVRLNSGNGDAKLDIMGNDGIVSGLGVMHSYQMLLGMRSKTPPSSSTPVFDQPRGLLGACEARPKIHCVFWVKSNPSGNVGTDIHAFDYFEYPGFTPAKVPEQPAVNSDGERLPPSYLTTASGSDDVSTEGVFVRDYVRIWSPSVKDATNRHKDVQVVIVEMEAGDEVINKMICPVYTTLSMKSPESPTMLVEKQVQGAYACFLPTEKPKKFSVGGAKVQLSAAQEEFVLCHAREKLIQLYPRQGFDRQILESAVITGHVGGRKLSAVCHKFSFGDEVNIGCNCEGYENMYNTGTDITFNGFAGDMQAGWVVANSILGYSRDDVLNGKHILNDL